MDIALLLNIKLPPLLKPWSLTAAHVEFPEIPLECPRDPRTPLEVPFRAPRVPFLIGRTPRGSCNRTLLRRVLRRFFKGSAS